MTSPNRPARLNRALLAIAGAVLLAAGAFVLATGFGLLPLLAGDGPILSATPRLAGWMPWVAAATSIIIGLLCLRWLLAQTLRRAHTGTWQLSTTPRRGSTHLDADTAATPLVDEIETYPGVRTARARLAGDRSHPILHLVVSTEDRADIGRLRHHIDTEALPRLRQALELEHLQTNLLLRLDDARGRRTH
ncbi:hypothetical protein J2S53_003076 [Actinopolyspora lacussalsi]|nr:hypothetical protein [Actinopolyspora lacussalsi]